MDFKEWWILFKEEHSGLDPHEFYHLDISEELVQKGWNAAIKNKDEEIERLRKEKAWLMKQLIIKTERKKGTTEIEIRNGYLKEMQQALKGPLEIITGPAPPEAKELKGCKRYFDTH